MSRKLTEIMKPVLDIGTDELLKKAQCIINGELDRKGYVTSAEIRNTVSSLFGVEFNIAENYPWNSFGYVKKEFEFDFQTK